MMQGITKKLSHEVFESFFSLSNQVAFLQDTQGIIQDCNNAARLTFGFNSINSMIGKTPFDFQCKAVESAESFILLDKRVHEDKTTLNCIISDIYSYGPDIHIVEKMPVIDSGNIVGILTRGQQIKGSHFLSSINASLPGKCQKKWGYPKKLYSIGYKNRDLDLTDKEEECLFYVSHGMSAKEIANTLRRSHRTIETHLNHLRHKFNCNTKKELVEKSIAYGYADKIPTSLISKGFILLL